MQNIKSTVLSALQTATALATLQDNKFYFHYPPDFTNLPVGSYFELSNLGNLYADDIEAGSEIIFQIDLWGKSSLSILAQGVDDVMIGLEFNRILSQDLFETDLLIYHKSMRYRIDYFDPNF